MSRHLEEMQEFLQDRLQEVDPTATLNCWGEEGEQSKEEEVGFESWRRVGEEAFKLVGSRNRVVAGEVDKKQKQEDGLKIESPNGMPNEIGANIVKVASVEADEGTTEEVNEGVRVHRLLPPSPTPAQPPRASPAAASWDSPQFGWLEWPRQQHQPHRQAKHVGGNSSSSEVEESMAEKGEEGRVEVADGEEGRRTTAALASSIACPSHPFPLTLYLLFTFLPNHKRIYNR